MERDATTLDRRMNDLLERCREAGMHVTPQRMAIYRTLLEAEDHPSPEELYSRVRAKMPSLSLATIYKVLDALTRLGAVQEVSMISESKRYDANMERHHHLICTKCKKIIDLHDDGLDAIPPPRRLKGFVPHVVSVQVMGVCGTCAKRR